MTVDRAYLEAERAKHPKQHSPDGDFCRLCGARLGDFHWPCKQSEILDLALSAEGYREALETAAPKEGYVQDEQGGCVWCGMSPYPPKRKRRRPDGLSVFDFPPFDEHRDDCGWKMARAALGEVQ